MAYATQRNGRVDERASRLVLTLLVALVGWTLLTGLLPLLPDAPAAQIPRIARAITAGVFVAAAAMQLARWRITRNPQLAFGGCALAMLGVGLARLGQLAGMSHDGAAPAPAVRLLVVVPVLVVLGWATRTGAQRQLRLLPVAALALAIGTTAGAAALGHADAAAALPGAHSWVWLCTGTLTTWAWATFAGSAFRRIRSGSCGWFAAGLALLSLAEALGTLAVAVPGAALTLATGVQLVAAAGIATAAALALNTTVETRRQPDGLLAGELDEALRLLRRFEQLERERLHDARSAVVGILGASQLLSTSHGSALRDPDEVHRMMSAELTRMTRLLDPDLVEPLIEFDLAAALTPMITARRLAGTRVRNELGPVWVRGRLGLTTTAVGNLITNAVVHAPGAAVTVRATAVGGRVELSVEDAGPGIPATERQQVLRAGVRGSGARASGSGLGLSSAGAAMAAQSGSLRLEERPGGGTRVVLTLPAGRAAAVSVPARVS